MNDIVPPLGWDQPQTLRPVAVASLWAVGVYHRSHVPVGLRGRHVRAERVPMRAFVTGGSGFIGAALTSALVGAGAEVHLLLHPGGPRGRLAGLERRCAVHEADLLDAAAVRRAVDSALPEVI